MELTNQQKMMIGAGVFLLCILLLMAKKQAETQRKLSALERETYAANSEAKQGSQAAQPKTDGLSPEQIAKIAAQAATETVAKMAKAHDERKSEAAQTTEKVATDAPAEAVKG